MNCGCKSTGHEPGCFMLTATNLHPYSDAPASDQQVTIEQALAEGMRATGGQLNGSYDDIAAAILATEPMQAIARQAAIGAAVERLQQAAMDSGYPTEAWSLIALMPDRVQVECHFGTTWDREADTLPAAITAALGDSDE